MAEKRSKSILTGLKDMLHLDSEKSAKPSAPAKKAAAAQKHAAPAPKAKEPRPAAPAAEAPAAPDSGAEPKAEKSKVKAQPWYRHRQRW
jgi:hypothetical protein